MVIQRSFGELVVVLTTEANSDIGDCLARELLNRRLAACVSLREINSHFWWEGKLNQNKEVELLIKTTKCQLDNLLEAIKKLHSYQTPELLHWNVSASDDYLKWSNEVVSSSAK